MLSLFDDCLYLVKVTKLFFNKNIKKVHFFLDPTFHTHSADFIKLLQQILFNFIKILSKGKLKLGLPIKNDFFLFGQNLT